MAHYGLIGRTLVHSFSKSYFDQRFAREQVAHTYGLFEIEQISQLGLLIEQQQLSGFNVTIPYKEQILPLLDALTPEAHAIGAVNVVNVHGRQLVGHNTDAPAFLQTLTPHLKSHHTKALVLGTGGASKAVIHALRELGIPYTLVSRHPDEDSVGYAEAGQLLHDTPLLVNATPVGTYPDIAAIPPIDLRGLTPSHLVYDLVYNPSPTQLLREAALRGATTIDGLPMLHRQADLAYQIWTQAQ